MSGPNILSYKGFPLQVSWSKVGHLGPYKVKKQQRQFLQKIIARDLVLLAVVAQVTVLIPTSRTMCQQPPPGSFKEAFIKAAAYGASLSLVWVWAETTLTMSA